jgi:hypothetical protein
MRKFYHERQTAFDDTILKNIWNPSPLIPPARGWEKKRRLTKSG